MAGPGAQILFATTAAPCWQAMLDETIDLVRSGERTEDEFWVGTTRPVGGSYEGEGRPFLVSVGIDLPWELGTVGDLDGVQAPLPGSRRYPERHEQSA